MALKLKLEPGQSDGSGSEAQMLMMTNKDETISFFVFNDSLFTLSKIGTSQVSNENKEIQ